MANQPLTLDSSSIACIIGIDLAWGEHNGDGLCLLRVNRENGRLHAIDHKFGDIELIAWLKGNIGENEPTLILIDAPLIITNQIGQRPVEGKVSRLFHREHASCHSSNLNMPHCKRLVRVSQLLRDEGYLVGYDLSASARLVAETYPHPAMVRLFGLTKILKYKKGAEKQSEFKRLQNLILECVVKHFSSLKLSEEATGLLSEKWNQPNEDRTDAFVCALIAYHHWIHHGTRSQVIGDLETGFILLPAETRF